MRTILPDWVARRHDAEEAKRIIENPTPTQSDHESKSVTISRNMQRNIFLGVKYPNGIRMRGTMSPSIRTRRRRG